MYRRVVSLLLLPGLLLSQAAAAGHTHGDHTPADHSIRPHVHTAPAVVADRHHARGHHHGPGGHHHYHDEDDEGSFPSPTVPPPQAEPPADHDADALFVPVVTVGVERPASVGVFVAAVVWVVCEAVGGTLGVFMCPAGNGRPPPDPACPLYVRHLALLM